MEPTYFAVIVLVLGFLANGTSVLYMQMALTLFGAAAAVSLPALGGASITPAVFFLPFLLFRALRERDPKSLFTVVPSAGGWLLLLVLWGLISAYLLPRAFAGDVQILTIDRTSGELGAKLRSLGPVSGNITQPVYTLGSFCALLCFWSLLRRPGRMAHFGGAVLLLAALNVLAALLNLGEFYLGLPKMLELVRNGGYAMFDAYEEAGLMRIQGTLSETSGFAAMTLPLFAFSFSLWLNNQRPLYAGPIAFMSVLLLVMSTSGTAYTSLAAYLVGVGIVYLWRAYLRRRSPRLLALSVGSSLFVLAVSAAFIFEVPFTVKVTEFLQHTVFSKLESKSGVERSMWNAQCWANFLDTYGIGVGLGTARASSYPLVLLSNVGLLGTGLFLAFLGSTFRGSNRNPKDQFVVEASRYALFAQLLTACISGAVFDLGVAFYAFAAAANVRGVVTRKLDATGPEHFTPDSGVVQT